MYQCSNFKIGNLWVDSAKMCCSCLVSGGGERKKNTSGQAPPEFWWSQSNQSSHMPFNKSCDVMTCFF